MSNSNTGNAREGRCYKWRNTYRQNKFQVQLEHLNIIPFQIPFLQSCKQEKGSVCLTKHIKVYCSEVRRMDSRVILELTH